MWLRIEDHKPPVWGAFLCYSEAYGMQILEYQLKDGGLDGRKAGNFYDLDNDGAESMNYQITHWMMLPSPPKKYKGHGGCLSPENGPKNCYRVRCYLGGKCVEEETHNAK